MRLGKDILNVFLVLNGVPEALDVSCSVPKGGLNKLMKREGYHGHPGLS